MHSARGDIAFAVPASRIVRAPFPKTLLLLATTALSGALGTSAAEAACSPCSWDVTSGIWSNGANWTPAGGPPGSASTVSIGNGGTATIDATGAQSAGGGIFNGSSVVILPGGTWTVSAASVDIGDSSTGGALTVNGGTLNDTGGNMGVGVFGGNATNILLIENGGVVTTTNGGQVGEIGGGNSVGIVTVTGAGSTWNVGPGNLDVENPGNTTGVTIENGASLISGESFIGAGGAAGSNNNVLITGAGTTWQSGTIVLGTFPGQGASSTGALTIANGAAVSTVGFVVIGYSPDSGNGFKDAVTVDGAGSKLTVTGSGTGTLYAGYYGTGALTVSNGAVVSDTTGIIAYTSANASAAGVRFGVTTPTNSTGSVLVTGPGSLWSNNSLIVGDNASVVVTGILGTGTGTSVATLTIANGGEVASINAISVAANAGATGIINIGAGIGQAAAAPGTISAPAIQFGAGTGEIVFNHTSSGYTFAVPILGAGNVDVEGGTTFLTATNSYTGATTVNGGTLDVTGALTDTSGVTVNNGGTLGGSGRISSNVAINSGGTFAPGAPSTPGTATTINGSLAFQSGALYAITFNGAAATMANISGTASLAGTVAATLAPGSSLAKASSYDILRSAGLGGSTFGGVSAMPNLATSLSYTPTDVFLNVTAAQLGQSSGLNTNQQNAANAINGFFNNGGTLPSSLVDLFRLTGANLGNALTQVSGELATGAQQATFDAMNEFMSLLTDPFMGRGNGVGGAAGPAGYADESANAYASTKKLSAERDAYAMFTKAPLANVYQPRWSVWAAGFGGSQTTDGNAALGSNSATSRIAGTAVGADYLFSPNTIAGFALAGGATSLSVNNLGSGRSDLFQAGAYVRHTNGAAYITGALAYGWQDITTNRTVTLAGIDQLRAEFNANTVAGRVEGGYRFVAPIAGGVTPYAAGQFTTFDLPAYAEQTTAGSNMFALAYGAKDVTDVRSELGLRSDKSFPLQGGILTLRGRLAWAHDYDPDRSVGATFQSLPGASFVVNGAAQAADSALTTASVEMRWLNGWSAAGTFEGEFSDVTSSYAGKGVVRYQW